MARITTNTTGTQPVIQITFASDTAFANALTLPMVQDVTMTNSTGVFSYTSFSDTDVRKLSTPADNTVTTNIVVDDTTFFGTGATTTAVTQGVQSLSGNKVLILFRVYWAGNAAGATDRYRQGQGFITNLAPKTSVTEPVWVTPLEIAVDGSYTDGMA